MITPIYRDRDGRAIGFMSFGQALMESENEYGEDLVQDKNVIATNIIGKIMGNGEFASHDHDFGEGVLIDMIDRGLFCTDIFQDEFYQTIYFCSNPDNRIRAWHDRNFRPADAVHPIHKDGNQHFLSKTQHRKIRTWDVEVVAA